jgi:hypothetical protein
MRPPRQNTHKTFVLTFRVKNARFNLKNCERMILGDISDVMQNPHPVFGIPLGVCLLLFALLKAFKSNDSPNNFGSNSDGTKCKPPPPINTSKYGQHEFNRNGFCLKCGWERDFLVRMNRSNCEVETIANKKL